MIVAVDKRHEKQRPGNPGRFFFNLTISPPRMSGVMDNFV